jgi:hypothetical protein
MATSIGDRESDIFAAYASVPEERFHVIARSMHDPKFGSCPVASQFGGGISTFERSQSAHAGAARRGGARS